MKKVLFAITGLGGGGAERVVSVWASQLAEKGYKTISLNSEKFIHFESQTIGKTFNYYKKF